MGTFISGGTWFNAPDDSPPMASGVEMAASARPPRWGRFFAKGAANRGGLTFRDAKSLPEERTRRKVSESAAASG